MKRQKIFIRLSCLLLVVILIACLTSCKSKYIEDEKQIVAEKTNEVTENDTPYIPQTETYILNIKSKKIHKTTCGTGDLISPENRKTYSGEIEDLFDDGYTLCGNCYK